MGCLALPEEVFERAYCGEDLTPEEDAMFRAHPETSAVLLSEIPRLEAVAEIVRCQLQSPSEFSVADHSNQSVDQRGVDMLRAALAFDQRLYRGIAARAALDELRSSGQFNPRILKALEGYTPVETGYEVQRLAIRDLRAGMVLEADVSSRDGDFLILKGGTILTETWIERLKNFAITRGAQEPVNVRVPSLTGLLY
jgi:hypothetical protein